MSLAVLADAQFSTVTILRPYAGFEADYQGTTVNRPIMVSPVLSGTGGEPRDQLAIDGQPGYDPRLIRGVPTPVGSRVVIEVPKIAAGAGDDRYIWVIQWRLRNLHDFREARIPWSIPKQGEGVPDAGEPRVVIPASDHTVIYSAPTPLGALDRVLQTGRTEDISFGSDNLFRPNLPNAVPAGTWQQGLFNPALVSAADLPYVPTYQHHEVLAVGNEILLGVYRTIGLGANWDFTQPPFPGPDAELSQLLGNGEGSPFSSIGAYVATGSAP